MASGTPAVIPNIWYVEPLWLQEEVPGAPELNQILASFAIPPDMVGEIGGNYASTFARMLRQEGARDE